MEVRVRMPSPPLDFSFHGGRSSPCSPAPSPPRASGDRYCYISAPTSPSRASEFYREFDDFSMIDQTEATALPGETDDFAFHVNVSSETPKPSVSAEELFYGGRIRTQKPPATEPYGGGDRGTEPVTSLRSPLLSPKSKGRKSFWSAFTPKGKKHTNPFASILDDTEGREHVRGRERVSHSPLSKSASRRRGIMRSLSPTRKHPWEDHQKIKEPAPGSISISNPPSSPTSLAAPTQSKSSRRWRLKNFLLFRSASEGRASDKDPMRKVTAFYRRQQEEVKVSSSTTAEKSAPSRRAPVSAHERHYTVNKAASDDLKKKTFLPYKQGILGRLAVNPTVHALAHGFGSLPSG